MPMIKFGNRYTRYQYYLSSHLIYMPDIYYIIR